MNKTCLLQPWSCLPPQNVWLVLAWREFIGTKFISKLNSKLFRNRTHEASVLHNFVTVITRKKQYLSRDNLIHLFYLFHWFVHWSSKPFTLLGCTMSWWYLQLSVFHIRSSGLDQYVSLQLKPRLENFYFKLGCIIILNLL